MASEGTMWVDLTGVNGYNQGVRTTFASTAGQTYTLSFDLGALKAAGFGNVNAEVLLNDSASLGQFVNTTATVAGNWYDSGIDWERKTVSFVATGSSTALTFLGRANGGNSNDAGIALDNVSVVPEPTSLAMMLAGLGVIGIATRRRFHQRS